MRASIRRESQQRRMREKQHQRGLSASYLEPDRYDEEEEGEESISLAAIKTDTKGAFEVSLSRNEISSFQGCGIHLCIQYTVNAESLGILFLRNQC